jgi:hypothetical protein
LKHPSKIEGTNKGAFMKSNLTILLAISWLILSTGCMSKNRNSANMMNAITTYPPESPPGQGINSTGNNWNYGNTVDFYPVSTATMEDYVATRPLNMPHDYRININLTKLNENTSLNKPAKYTGHVKLQYSDNGMIYEGYFDAGSGTVQNSYKNLDNGKAAAEFNQWFSYNGKESFHAFFQDAQGAIIVVIDNVQSINNDATITGGKFASGSVWYKNFGITYAPSSPEKCWFIRTGPYNCRTFVVGDLIQTTTSLYPSNGYQKLGTFSGLDISKAFNGTK